MDRVGDREEREQFECENDRYEDRNPPFPSFPLREQNNRYQRPDRHDGGRIGELGEELREGVH